MGDRATLERIFAIMRRLLLVPMDGATPIPRKGTTRHECYRALYEIQELLETRRYSREHLPQSNADRIRAMTDEELAEFMCHNVSNGTVNCAFCGAAEFCRMGHNGWLDWLKQEAET